MPNGKLGGGNADFTDHTLAGESRYREVEHCNSYSSYFYSPNEHRKDNFKLFARSLHLRLFSHYDSDLSIYSLTAVTHSSPFESITVVTLSKPATMSILSSFFAVLGYCSLAADVRKYKEKNDDWRLDCGVL